MRSTQINRSSPKLLDCGLVAGRNLRAIAWYALATSAVLIAQQARCAEDASPGSEADFTRPLTRFHLRNQYVGKADGALQNRTISRIDHTVPLGGHWKFGGRLDVPFLINDSTSSDNPAGHTRGGTGDLLTQVSLIHSPTERFAYGLGMRLTLPTASEDQFGDGKWQLHPIVGARYSLPQLSKGSYFAPLVRYSFDAGGDYHRSHVSQLRMSPTLNIALPERWFVTLFPSQDIVLNTIGGQRWFVPVDVLVGRKITERSTVAMEVSLPVIKQFSLYDYKIEARVSLSF